MSPLKLVFLDTDCYIPQQSVYVHDNMRKQDVNDIITYFPFMNEMDFIPSTVE